MKAGFVYFALVFALGFALGWGRTLALPYLPSRLAGVMIEVPIMLAASWAACGLVVRWFALAPRLGPRLVMGATAFALLMLAEILTGLALSGRSPLEHFALYREPSYALGLAAQLVFALIPALRLAGIPRQD